MGAYLATALAQEKSSAGASVTFPKYPGIDGPLLIPANPATPDTVQPAFTALRKVLDAERACYLGPSEAQYTLLCLKGVDYPSLAKAAGAVAAAAAALKPPLSDSPAAAFYAALAKLPPGKPLSTPPSGGDQSASLPTFQGLVGINVAGASASNASAALLAQLTLDVPVGDEPNGHQPVWDHLFWLWGNLRVGSIAPPANLAGLSASTLYQTASSAGACKSRSR